MIVEVHDAETLSGPERFVRRVLCEGGVDLPCIAGLALFGVTVPRRRRFRGTDVHLLVWTPHRCIVVQIYGLASVQHGELDIRSNGRWFVGERPADLQLPKSVVNPLVQARRHTLDVQALFERHDLPHQLETLVVLVPKTSSRITGHPPDFGNDVGVLLACSRQSGPLYRHLNREIEGTSSWDVDNIVRAWTVLGRADDVPERAALAAQGFADTNSAPAAVPLAESEVDHAAVGDQSPGESVSTSGATAADWSSTVDRSEPMVAADHASTGDPVPSSSDADDDVGAVPVASIGAETLDMRKESAGRPGRATRRTTLAASDRGDTFTVAESLPAQKPGTHVAEPSPESAHSAPVGTPMTDRAKKHLHRLRFPGFSGSGRVGSNHSRQLTSPSSDIESEHDSVLPPRDRRRSSTVLWSLTGPAGDRRRRPFGTVGFGGGRRPRDDAGPQEPTDRSQDGNDAPTPRQRWQAAGTDRRPNAVLVSRRAAHVPAAATKASTAGARPAASRNESGQCRSKRVPTAGFSLLVVVFVVLVFGACAVGKRFDVGDYAAMCGSPRAFTEAADYTENRPSPVAAVGELDGLTGNGGSALWHPDEASSVQLVACLSQVRTGELVGTCRYEPGRGHPVGRTLNLFHAVYRLTVYEAATGSRLATTDIEGSRFSDDPASHTETDSCRAAATTADEEDLPGRRYSRVSRAQIHEVLDPVVQYGHRAERQR